MLNLICDVFYNTKTLFRIIFFRLICMGLLVTSLFDPLFIRPFLWGFFYLIEITLLYIYFSCSEISKTLAVCKEIVELP